MAFASLGTLGSNQSKTAGANLAMTTVTTALSIGNVCVVVVAKDPIASSSGGANTNEFTGVTDSAGNTYTKAYEWSNATASGSGVVTAVYYSVLTTALPTSSTITASFSSTTAKAITAWGFSVGSGSTVSIDGTPSGQSSAGTQTVSGLSSVEHLAIRGYGFENAAPLTYLPSSGWTGFTQATTAGAGSASNINVQGNWSIQSAATSVTNTPSSANSGTNAEVLVALKEVAPSGISLVESGTFASGASTTSTGSYSFTTTLQQNDIVVVSYSNCATSDYAAVAGTTLIPTGYTAAHTDLYADGGAFDTNLQVSYKVMGSTPDTTVTLPASTSANDSYGATVYVFRGADTTTPFDTTATQTYTDNTAGSNPDAPSVTPNNAGGWIIASGAGGESNSGTTLSSAPSNMTDGLRSSSSSGANKLVFGTALLKTWTSGAFDPGAWGGANTANNGSSAAVTLVLNKSGSTGSSGGTTNAPVTMCWF